MDNKIQAEPTAPKQPAPPYQAAPAYQPPPPQQPAPPYQAAPPYQQPPPQQPAPPYQAAPAYQQPPPQQPAPPYQQPQQAAAPAQPLFTPEMADATKRAFANAKNVTGSVATEGLGFFKKFIQTPVEALGSSSLSLPLGVTMLVINIAGVTLMLDRFIRGFLFAFAKLTADTNESLTAEVKKGLIKQLMESFKGAALFEGAQYAILALMFVLQAGLAVLFILFAVKLGKTGYTMPYRQAISAYAACTLPTTVAYLVGWGVTTLLSYNIFSTLLAFTVVFSMLIFSTLLYGKVIEPYMPDTNRRYLYLSFTNILQYTALLTVMGRYLAGVILPQFGSLL